MFAKVRQFVANLVTRRALALAAVLGMVLGGGALAHADGTPFINYTPSTDGSIGTLAVAWSTLGTALIALLVAGIGAMIGLYLIPIAIRLVKRAVAYFSGR